MPPATGPSSRTATRRPARARRYAVVSPAIPAPTTHTSTCTLCSSGSNRGRGWVAVQTDWWRVIVTPLEQETLLTCFLPHGHEFLGRRRVDADGRVELRLGRAQLHGDGDALDDLAGVRADHVRAYDALARPVDNELHEGSFLLLAHRELQCAERRLVNIDRAVALARALFREADRRDVRVRENRRGNIVVVDRCGLAAKQRAREPHCLGGRHRREVDAVRHVA